MGKEQRGFVKRGTVPKQMMIDLLNDRFGQGGYYIAQRADDCRFDRFRPDMAGWLVVNWAEGRVFSKELEVCWRKSGENQYDVVVLAETDLGLKRFGVESDGGEWQAIERKSVKAGIYLWGSYRESLESWVEARIPRRLFYPIEEDRTEGRFVRIGHVDYRAPNGAVQFVRLKEVL